MELEIKQIVATTAPMWAIVKVEEKEECLPIVCLALTVMHEVVPLTIDSMGEFFDPRKSEKFIKIVYTPEPEGDYGNVNEQPKESL